MKTIANLPSAVTATSRAGMESHLDEAAAVAKPKTLHEGRQPWQNPFGPDPAAKFIVGKRRGGPARLVRANDLRL
jgi:hypothetical protein